MPRIYRTQHRPRREEKEAEMRMELQMLRTHNQKLRRENARLRQQIAKLGLEPEEVGPTQEDEDDQPV